MSTAFRIAARPDHTCRCPKFSLAFYPSISRPVDSRRLVFVAQKTPQDYTVFFGRIFDAWLDDEDAAAAFFDPDPRSPCSWRCRNRIPNTRQWGSPHHLQGTLQAQQSVGPRACRARGEARRSAWRHWPGMAIAIWSFTTAFLDWARYATPSIRGYLSTRSSTSSITPRTASSFSISHLSAWSRN